MDKKKVNIRARRISNYDLRHYGIHARPASCDPLGIDIDSLERKYRDVVGDEYDEEQIDYFNPDPDPIIFDGGLHTHNNYGDYTINRDRWFDATLEIERQRELERRERTLARVAQILAEQNE